SIDAADLGIAHPTGLTYSSSAGVFMAVGAPGAAVAEMVTFDPFENTTGTNRLVGALAQPLNTGFIAGSESLLTVNGATGEWLAVGIGPRGLQPAQVLGRFDASALRLGNPQGMAIDEAGGRVFILDAAGPNLVTVTADLSNLFGDLVAGRATVQ